MNSITSLFDLGVKMTADKRYRRLLIFGHLYAEGASPTAASSTEYTDQKFQRALQWLDSWLQRRNDDTCIKMVRYLNDHMRRIPNNEKNEPEPIEVIRQQPPTATSPAPSTPVPPRRPQPGEMAEYGWYDREIEDEISVQMSSRQISREDAIVAVFNSNNDSYRSSMFNDA